MTEPLRMAQFGTRHGHAPGKWRALCASSNVEPVGIWEPDPAVRSTARAGGAFADAFWFGSADEVLADPSVSAVAVEGRNHESLAMARSAVEAGKHVWFDKPAGDDWPGFVEVMDAAQGHGRHVQLGYMFRYSPGFQQLATWVHAGLLGNLFSIRAHMSTNVDAVERAQQSRHTGGVLYDLGGHMLDQIVWLLGRPSRVEAVLRNDATPELPTYADNTLAVLEFPRALAIVDIAAMEARPTARRFEVYGSRGSAILDGFDPARSIRVALEQAASGFPAGEHLVRLPDVSRQELYERELAAFVSTVRDNRPPDRSPEHERIVQETLLRTTGRILPVP